MSEECCCYGLEYESGGGRAKYWGICCCCCVAGDVTGEGLGFGLSDGDGGVGEEGVGTRIGGKCFLNL